MSRPLTSLLSSASSSISPLRVARLPAVRLVQSRTFLNQPPAPSSGSPRGSTANSASSIDYRVLEGLPHFLDKRNFERLDEWQGGLWERLQAEVRNNPRLAETRQKWDRSGLDMTDLLATTARDPALSLAFNYASLLLNNSYFLEGLHGGDPKPVPERYQNLEEKLVAYADGIVGGGWLWLVRSGEHPSNLDIVPTFSSGTLLVTNRTQRGRDDLLAAFGSPRDSGSDLVTGSSSTSTSTATSDSTSDFNPNSNSTTPDADSASASGSGLGSSFGSGSGSSSPTHSTPPLSQAARNARRDRKSTVYPIPLATLNLFETAYLGDKYGVWGRKAYARDWWRSLDWSKIDERNART